MKKLLAVGAACLLTSMSILTTAVGQEAASDTQEPLFTDIPLTHPNMVAIRFLKENEIIKGYDDGSFKPDRKVNRAEALKFILAGSGISVGDDDAGSPFSDVPADAWYSRYVTKAKGMNIVGGNPDGTFTPGNSVRRSGFMKMLLMAQNFNPDKWRSPREFPDVDENAWFYPYMTYAGHSGLISADTNGNLFPGQELSRAEVAEVIYLMIIIRNGNNLSLLMSEAEQQILQIDRYVAAGQLVAAKRASELAVDYTQQAYTIKSDDMNVLGLAKIAKAYDFVLTAFIAGVQKENDLAKEYALQAITKAQEAIDVNEETRTLAEYIQTRANEVLGQIN